MTFELLPIIDTMLNLYEMPLNQERFQAYLKILQGDTKGDLKMPIGGFNPMAKPHIKEKLIELKKLGAENIIQETLATLNTRFDKLNKGTYQVALNLSDDIAGGWTNHYTSDYDSKFRLNALVERQFCVPIFWASEQFSEALIRQRTEEYVLRTIYWLDHTKPLTLKDHIEQEKFVAKNSPFSNDGRMQQDIEKLDAFYKKNQDATNYSIIFNFLYGDKAASAFNFPTFGIGGEMAGFMYAGDLAE
jgi:hypothetical protein